MGYNPVNRGKVEARAELEVAALKLRQKGMSYGQIAHNLNCSKSSALSYVRASLDRLAKQNDTESRNLRTLELAKLDDLYQRAYQVLEATHYVIAAGGVVEHEGVPMLDDAPVLRAIDRLVNISERRCSLLGIDVKPDELAEPPTIVINMPRTDGN